VRTRTTAGAVTFTGLDGGETYYVRVRASNADGDSSWSITQSETIAPTTAPTITLRRASGSTTVSVALGTVAGATSYRWRVGSTGAWNSGQTGSFTGVRGSTHTVQGQARNAGGDSPIGSANIAVPHLPGTPSLTLVVSGTSITATVGAGTGSVPTSYSLRITGTGLAIGGITRTRNTPGSETFSGLTRGGTYTVTATASNAEGTSAAASRTAAIAALNPPGRPSLVLTVSGTTITATVAAASTGGTPTGYRFELSEAASFPGMPSNPTTVKTRTTAGAVTFTGLDEGETYYVRVRASNADGNSSWSITRSLRVPVPSPPVPTFRVRSSSGSAIVDRLASTGATSFTVQLSESNTFPAGSTLVRTTTGTQVTFSNLTPGTTYYVRARANKTGASASAYSSPSSVTITLDAPTLTLTSAVAGRIEATVTAVSGATGYEIQISQNQFFSSGVRSATRNASGTASFTGLVSGTWYGRARSTRGTQRSAWSTRQSVTVRDNGGGN